MNLHREGKKIYHRKDAKNVKEMRRRTMGARTEAARERAEKILEIIQKESLREHQIAVRMGLSGYQVENALIFIENNLCLLSQDEGGRIHIFEE